MMIMMFCGVLKKYAELQLFRLKCLRLLAGWKVIWGSSSPIEAFCQINLEYVLNTRDVNTDVQHM